MNTYKIKRFLISIVYPNRCPFCNKIINTNNYYCYHCVGKLDYSYKIEKINNISVFYSVCRYDDVSKNLILRLKEERNSYIVSAIAKLISDVVKKNYITESIDYIIPVPMFKKNLKVRGYNQSELIAYEISQILDIPMIKNLLIKTKETSVQKALSEKERKENLKDAFSITDKNLCQNKIFLIIDDVCTTGSTLSEIAGILLSSGAKEIFASTFAKT